MKTVSAEDRLMAKIAGADNSQVLEYLKSKGYFAETISTALSTLTNLSNQITSTQSLRAEGEDMKLTQIANAISQFEAALSNIISRETKAW
jgi:hypothetical protein